MDSVSIPWEMRVKAIGGLTFSLLYPAFHVLVHRLLLSHFPSTALYTEDCINTAVHALHNISVFTSATFNRKPYKRVDISLLLILIAIGQESRRAWNKHDSLALGRNVCELSKMVALFQRSGSVPNQMNSPLQVFFQLVPVHSLRKKALASNKLIKNKWFSFVFNALSNRNAKFVNI